MTLINVKLSNSELNKLKFEIKNGSEVPLKISSNVVGDSNDENNFFINFYYLIHKFWGFLKLLQMVHQLI